MYEDIDQALQPLLQNLVDPEDAVYFRDGEQKLYKITLIQEEEEANEEQVAQPFDENLATDSLQMQKEALKQRIG